MATELTVRIDGKECAALQGETIVEVASRSGVEIPTLCHDPRFDPAGACRMCLVEVEGQRRLQPGLRVPGRRRDGDPHRLRAIERHQQAPARLYLADHRLERRLADPRDRQRQRAARAGRKIGAPLD